MAVLKACTPQQSTAQSAERSIKKEIAKEQGIKLEKEPTSCVCRTNCIERPLRAYFEKHGRYVAKHPYPFFIIPIILTACMGYGLRHMTIINDTEYLVTPRNGDSKGERDIVQKYFQVNQDGGFMPEAGPHLDGFLDVILATRDESSVLTTEHVSTLVRLEQIIGNITVDDDSGQPYGFRDICATWNQDCMEQPVLLAYNRDPASVPTTDIHFPKNGFIFMGNSLGNVTVDPDTKVVTYARAARMTFFVKYESLAEQALAKRWFIKTTEVLGNLNDLSLDIFYGATNSLEVQFQEASEDIAPKFIAPFVLLVLFSIFSCMMNDWVRSKPYLAFMGVVSTGFSLATTFGFLSAVGISAVPQVGLVPFLTLGVGVDNMFILISAWRRTDVDALLGLPLEKRVQIRLGEAMKEAALSITITSLTDIMAFGIGTITEFRMVEIFCLYTGMSILFAYLFCITFFAATMVFSGWREEANRHCFTVQKVQSKKEAKDRSMWYRIWCAGGKPGRYQEDTDMKASRKEMFLPMNPAEQPSNEDDDHIIMNFFKNYFAPTLMTPWFKAIVAIVYIAYLTGAIWGCVYLRRGVSFEKLSNQNSFLANYYTHKDIFFSQYSVSVGIVVEGNLDYSDPKIQDDMDRIIGTFLNSSAYFCDDNTQSWLRNFNDYLEFYPRKPKTPEDYVSTLRYTYLKTPGLDRNKLDIAFNEDGTQIIASRFYIQSLWYKKTEEIMLEARRIAATIQDYDVTVFHQTFIYFDQPVVVWKNTITNIILALVCMLVIAMMFVPQPMSAIWVTLATASIECGVIGYMTWWDVNVDFVSMTYLILCIGFSIDFSVHITYGFIASQKQTGRDQAVDALHSVGYPVLQSATSTLLGVIFLVTSFSYMFLSFLKTMILVISFGVFHALFILPIALSLLNTSCGDSCTEPADCGCECTQEEVTQKGKHIIVTVVEAGACADHCSETSSLSAHHCAAETESIIDNTAVTADIAHPSVVLNISDSIAEERPSTSQTVPEAVTPTYDVRMITSSTLVNEICSTV